MATNELIDPPVPADNEPTHRRGLLLLLLVANSAMMAVYMGVGSVLLPTQIAEIAGDDKVAVLGLIGGISAIFATAFNPIAGALSDRSGRRNPWVLGGGLGSLACLALLGSVSTALLVGIGWCLVQATMNVYQAAVTAIVPDRVPTARRGTASALVGLGLPIGGTVGVLIASQTAEHLRVGYLVFGGVIAGAALLLTTLCRDLPRSDTGQAAPAVPAVPKGAQVKAFLSALGHHDFRWAFIGRALMVLGYFSVVGYQLYILDDHIQLPAGLAAPAAIAVLTPSRWSRWPSRRWSAGCCPTAGTAGRSSSGSPRPSPGWSWWCPYSARPGRA